MTWSPVSTWGAKYGRCLPRRMWATDEARRPRTSPSASTTYQVLWISETFGENVRTRPIFRIRVVGETASGPGSRGGLNGPGGPESRRTRIGPLAEGGRQPPWTASDGRQTIAHKDRAQAWLCGRIRL